MNQPLHRRQLLFAGGMAICAWTLSRDLFADQVATLKESLKAGLKCRRPVEFEFIDKVVAFVEAGKLPKDLVLNTFDWARKQRQDIPFPYFQQALILRAGKIGVSL